MPYTLKQHCVGRYAGEQRHMMTLQRLSDVSLGPSQLSD